MPPWPLLLLLLFSHFQEEKKKSQSQPRCLRWRRVTYPHAPVHTLTLPCFASHIVPVEEINALARRHLHLLPLQDQACKNALSRTQTRTEYFYLFSAKTLGCQTRSLWLHLKQIQIEISAINQMPQISSSCGFEHALWILRSGDIRFHSAEKFKNILHFQGKKNKYGLHYKALHQICAYAHTHNSFDEAECCRSTFED